MTSISIRIYVERSPLSDLADLLRSKGAPVEGETLDDIVTAIYYLPFKGETPVPGWQTGFPGVDNKTPTLRVRPAGTTRLLSSEEKAALITAINDQYADLPSDATDADIRAILSDWDPCEYGPPPDPVSGWPDIRLGQPPHTLRLLINRKRRDNGRALYANIRTGDPLQVDWGDGTVETIAKQYSDNAQLYHEYTNADDEYVVAEIAIPNPLRNSASTRQSLLYPATGIVWASLRDGFGQWIVSGYGSHTQRIDWLGGRVAWSLNSFYLNQQLIEIFGKMGPGTMTGFGSIAYLANNSIHQHQPKTLDLNGTTLAWNSWQGSRLLQQPMVIRRLATGMITRWPYVTDLRFLEMSPNITGDLDLSAAMGNYPRYSALDGEALNRIFDDLADLTPNNDRTITITGAVGANDCDPESALDKGWEVVV